MKNNVLKILFLILMLAGMLFLCVFQYRTVHKNIVKSEHLIENLLESKKLVNSFEIESISINGTPLINDTDTGIYYYSLGDNIDISDSLLNNIEVNSYENNLKVALLENCIDEESVRQSEPIPIYLYTPREYSIVYLICSTLPFISVDTVNNAVIEENDVSCVLEVIDGRGVMFSSDALIHLRGATSSYYDKRAYKIELRQGDKKNKASLLGMREDDDWILYPAYNDADKIRNVFSTNLWYETCSKNNSLDLELGLQYKYCELFRNGTYDGLYALGYPVDNKMLNIDTKQEKEFLFACKDQVFSFAECNTELLENDANSYQLSIFELKGDYPSSFGANNNEFLKKYIRSLYNNEGLSDEELMSLVDLDNAIDVWLFSNMIQSTDQCSMSNGDMVNYYVAIKQNKKGNPIVEYIPWDLDLTWGNVRDYNPETMDSNLHTLQYCVSPSHNQPMYCSMVEVLLQRNNELVWNEVIDRYGELRDTVWSDEALVERLKTYEKQIYKSGAYRRDMERWPQGIYQTDIDSALSTYISYVLKRMKYMDAYMQRLEVLRNKGKLALLLTEYDDLSGYDVVVEVFDKSIYEEVDVRNLFGEIGINDVDENADLIVKHATDGYCEYIQMEPGVQNIAAVRGGYIIWDRDFQSYENERCLSLFYNDREIYVYNPDKGVRMHIVLVLDEEIKALRLDNFHDYEYR